MSTVSFELQLHHNAYTIIIFSGVRVGLENLVYTVVEGGALAEVCAILISGTLRRELSLTFLTIPGNATCKYLTGDIFM